MMLIGRLPTLSRGHIWRRGSVPSNCRTRNTATTMMCGAEVRVDPEPSMIDEPVQIHVQGLPTSSLVHVKLSLCVPEEKFDFESRNFFHAGSDGTLDLTSSPSLPGGTYEGIDPMGIFWSLRPLRKSVDGIQPINVTVPLSFDLQIYGPMSGSSSKVELNWDRADDFSSLLTSCTIQRSCVAPNVQRIPIHQGQVRGTLFLPPPSGTANQRGLPLVLTIYGGIVRGHVIEERAALLASKGFASMAVAYFGVDDLPKRYKDVRIEYFEDAINAAIQASQGVIDAQRIGCIGISKGGDLALSMVAFLKEKIRAAVILNSAIHSVATPTLYKDHRVDPLPVEISDFSKLKFREDQSLDLLGLLEPEKHPESVIPFANAPADLLFLAGSDDHNFQSVQFALEAQRLMEQAGKSNFEIQVLPGMGHMCHLPYSPALFTSAHPLAPPGIRLYMGGSETPVEHMQGQQRAWHKTVDFLAQKLKP